MPTNYHCKSCTLNFTVGWFHYHESGEGFWAETLLVCSACGTMHTVQHPDLVRIPVMCGLFSKAGPPKRPDRLLAQDGPRFGNGPERGVLGWLWLQEWHECKTTHELCPKSKHAYMKGFIDLSPVKCHHCGRAKTIVREWDFHNVRCPACGKPDLISRESWMT